MARGDVKIFEEFISDLAGAIQNLKDTTTLKLGLVDDTKTPLVSEGSPTWGDFSANEVSTAGGYTANGITLAWSGATRWAEADGVGTLDADDVSLAQDGDGFTDAYWGILYNDTAASDQAFAFVDLGGPVSEVDGPITIAWGANGILTITANPA